MTRSSAALAVLLLISFGRTDASAWSCDGHRVVAMLAERLLGPTAGRVTAILAAAPIDPQLRRGCAAVPSDPIADAATWADDERAADPATGSWHFINFPLAAGAPKGSIAPYCRAGSCIVDAIVAQLQTLATSSDPTRQANAVRFIIHLVGDLHQPLHAITNGDRGGNCVPVSYAGEPAEADERGNFSPNLHGVWDFNLVRRLMTNRRLADARALADDIAAARSFPRRVEATPATRTRLTAWARQSNAHARTIAYGRLAVAVPVEPATALTLTSCTDNRDVVHRMLALHEEVGDAYEQAAVPVVADQLRLAGIRLAQLLKAALPAR